jgi:hypothetical protein
MNIATKVPIKINIVAATTLNIMSKSKDLALMSALARLTYFKMINDPIAPTIIVDPKIIAPEKLS